MIMIAELWRLFTAVCAELDTDYLMGELVLNPDGVGEFLLREQRTRCHIPYPSWAAKQGLQAEWLELSEGVEKLTEILKRKEGGES